MAMISMPSSLILCVISFKSVYLFRIISKAFLAFQLRTSKTFLGDCDDLRVNFAQKIASDAPLDIAQYSAPSLFSFAVTSATSAFTGKRPEAEPEASEHSDGAFYALISN
jgi:hypothetical protein